MITLTVGFVVLFFVVPFTVDVRGAREFQYGAFYSLRV